MLTAVPVVGPVLVDALDKAQLHLVLGYSMFFSSGAPVEHRQLVAESAYVVPVGRGLAGIVATAVGTAWLSMLQGKNTVFFYQYLTPNVIAVAVAVFCAAKYWGERHTVVRMAALHWANFHLFLWHLYGAPIPSRGPGKPRDKLNWLTRSFRFQSQPY